MGKQVAVNENRRTIVFTSGNRLDLHNVVWFDKSGTHLRLKSDEGYTIVNPDKVEYHIIHPDADYQQAERKES